MREKQRKCLELSEILCIFAASNRQFVKHLNFKIMRNSKQQKDENRVKFPRLLGSVELYTYLCK